MFIENTAAPFGRPLRIVTADSLPPEEFVAVLTRMTPIAGGRGAVSEVEALNRSIIVRQYLRGGRVRFIARETFLRCGRESRSEHEFRILQHLTEDGIPVSRPLAAITEDSGFLRYRCWIATERVASARTLSSLLASSHDSSAELKDLCFEAGRAFGAALNSGVVHVDAHPGNVLVGFDMKTTLLDFDRAWFWDGRHSLKRLGLEIVTRWDRYVSKHRLPGYGTEPFREGVLGNRSRRE